MLLRFKGLALKIDRKDKDIFIKNNLRKTTFYKIILIFNIFDTYVLQI